MTIYYEQFLLMIIVKVLFIASIWCNAKADAIKDKTGYSNHGLKAMIVGFALLAFAPITVIIYFTEYSYAFIMLRIALMTGFSYLFLRAGIFNLMYNYCRDLQPDFIGTTDQYFDKHIKILKDWQDKGYFPYLYLFYFICFCLGLFL